MTDGGEERGLAQAAYGLAELADCRLVAPLLDELANEREDVRVAKLNVDEHGDIAMRYQVQSIPTFILFKGGQVADRMLGAVPKAAFQDFLSRNA